MAKVISAGILLCHQTSILVCHVTGQNHWDIPKGQVEYAETPEEAARREFEEETGISAKTFLLKDLGEFRYTKQKNLHLFLCRLSEKLDITKMNCLCRHEMDQYAYVYYAELSTYVISRLYRVLHKIGKEQHII